MESGEESCHRSYLWSAALNRKIARSQFLLINRAGVKLNHRERPVSGDRHDLLGRAGGMLPASTMRFCSPVMSSYVTTTGGMAVPSGIGTLTSNFGKMLFVMSDLSCVGMGGGKRPICLCTQAPLAQT
jgi:hypothetical protein